MPPIPIILDLADNTLIILGWTILVTATAMWVARHPGQDPLRTSPPRPNRLDLLMVWCCLLMLIVAMAIGNPLASLFLPAAMDTQLAEISKNIIASNLAQLLIAATGITVAHLAFAKGLRGFGFNLTAWRSVIAFATCGWMVATGVCMTIGMIVEELFKLLRPAGLVFETPLHPVIESLQDGQLPTTLRYLAAIGAMILAPVGEEVFYRGILQTSLQKIAAVRWGTMRHRWFAICITGILFGAMHTATPQHIPALAALGIILGFLYERTGSLLTPILLHMLFNGKTLLWLALLSRYPTTDQ